ncbi:hypothetical protein [Variovorax sp. SRS16]|uniref:hypothetical protein n=1 Tax=Variovorax sp. SRS16 TaxID=282217 RepID=UPI0013A5A9B1|nr:hypothetical protein [Variovorax sp. SRS16]
MEALEVKEITAVDAAATMRAAGLRAPLACDTPEDIAAYGQCFQLRTGTGVGVFVLRKQGGVMWIDGAGARVRGSGLTESGLALFDHIARQAGCTEIAFETNRPGLVRKSKLAGYVVAGYIMKKAVTP